MNKKINLVFSDDKLANGYDRNEFNRSCIGNWFSLRDEVSFTTEYQIKKDHNNIFVLECSSQLRNFWNQDNEIGDKGIFFDFPKEFQNLIKTNQVKLLISSLPEATPDLDSLEDEVEKYCKLSSIPINSLIFLDSNKAIENCKTIHSYYIPHFIHDNGFLAKQILEGETSKNELKYNPSVPTVDEAKNRLDREHYFISLNRSNHRKHRLILGCYFIEKNDDRILWSYLSIPDMLAGHHKPTERQKKLISNNIENLKSIIPKQIDTQVRNSKPGSAPQPWLPKHFYNLENFETSRNFDKERLSLNCYFDIVTETSFEDTDKLFFTEKIVRSIVNFHPFIVISSANYLKELKTFGFKTFDGLFDESYDEIIDRWERLDFILNEIDKILLKSPEEIKYLYNKYFDVCVYNRNHLFENIAIGKGSEFDEFFNKRIIGEFDE